MRQKKVRCGTWLYRFLIFAPLLTINSQTAKAKEKPKLSHGGHRKIQTSDTGSPIKVLCRFVSESESWLTVVQLNGKP